MFQQGNHYMKKNLIMNIYLEGKSYNKKNLYQNKNLLGIFYMKKNFGKNKFLRGIANILKNYLKNNILKNKYNKIFAHQMNTSLGGKIYMIQKIDLGNMFLGDIFHNIDYHFVKKKYLKDKDNIENCLNRNILLGYILYNSKNYQANKFLLDIVYILQPFFQNMFPHHNFYIQL